MSEPVTITENAAFGSFLPLEKLFSGIEEATSASCQFNDCTDGVFIQFKIQSFQASWTRFQVKAQILTNVQKSSYNINQKCFYMVGQANTISCYNAQNALLGQKIIKTINQEQAMVITLKKQNITETKLWSFVSNYCSTFKDKGGYFLICDIQTDDNSGHISGERNTLVYEPGFWEDSISLEPIPQGNKTQGVLEVTTYEQIQNLTYHHGQDASKPDIIMVLHTSNLKGLTTKLTSFDEVKPFVVALN